MLLGFPREYPPDDAERQLPDAVAARAALGERGAVLAALLARRRQALAALVRDAADRMLLDRVDDAVTLACARMALRHGHLGGDFHPYHNEEHAFDLCGERIDRLLRVVGADALGLRDWCVLILFGACHDLRQREAPSLVDGVGANERASWDESERILFACALSPQRDRDLFAALELAIVGSTFDARPLPAQPILNAADLVHSGGALAARLDQVLDARRPGWRDETHVAAALPLAAIAADLDTANVAEPFARFAASGEALCREREMLAGRSLAAGESARPVLAFLGDGQNRFFFELHRFHSDAGLATFGAAKQANAPKLKALIMGMRARIALGGAPRSGEEVIAAYRETLREVD